MTKIDCDVCSSLFGREFSVSRVRAGTALASAGRRAASLDQTNKMPAITAVCLNLSLRHSRLSECMSAMEPAAHQVRCLAGEVVNAGAFGVAG